MKTEYVVGFLCDPESTQVVLIEKQRPAWQQGKLNGIGGHIESGETPKEAVQREFSEEAGLDIGTWELGVVMEGKTWRVFFFFAFGPVFDVRGLTDERVLVCQLYPLPPSVLPNLRWLIPLCFDGDIMKPARVWDTMEPAAETKPGG